MLDELIYKVWENISRKVFGTYEQLRCIHNHNVPSAAYRFASDLCHIVTVFLISGNFLT